MEKVYEDDTVYLTNEIIGIKRYYFPFANEKDIPYNEISSVHLRKDFEASQEWGLHPKDETKWFNKDSEREFKPNYIELILKDQETKPCFSPNDCELVYKIITSQLEKVTQKDKENLESESNVEKEEKTEEELVQKNEE